MDIFGIGTRILNSVEYHEQQGRGSGRSYVLADVVRDGDVVIFSCMEDAVDFRGVMAKRGKGDVEFFAAVAPPDEPLAKPEFQVVLSLINKELKRDPKDRPRILYDHAWLERFYKATIANAIREIGIAPPEKHDA